jgi:MFS family permease
MAQADGSASWTAEQSRAAITAAGWHTGAIESDRARPTAGDPVPPARFAYFPAARDGVAVDAEVIQTDGRAAQVQLEVEPAGNGSLLPLIVAGLILGGVAGRLLAAALAQRTRTAPRRRRVTAAGLAGLAVVLLALPAGALFGNVLRAFRYAGDDGPVYTVHSAFTPGPYYPFGPYWLVAALTVAGVLAGAAMIAVAATGPEVQSRTETVRN